MGKNKENITNLSSAELARRAVKVNIHLAQQPYLQMRNFFNPKVLIFYLFQKTCCGYSFEVPHQGASNEYPQHMFSWRNKKKILYTPPPPLLIWSSEDFCKRLQILMAVIQGFELRRNNRDCLMYALVNDMSFMPS